MDSRFLPYLFLAVGVDERLGIRIFREGIVSEVDQFSLIFLQFLPCLGFVVANDIHFIIVNTIFVVLSVLNNFKIPVFLSFGKGLSLQKVTFEIFLFKFIQSALSQFSVLEFEVTGKILSDWKNTLAE